MIEPLGADGSIPFDDARARRASDRSLVGAIGAAVVLVAIGAGAWLLVSGHHANRSSRPDQAAGSTPVTTQDGRDLSQVSNDEMEAVVTANPDVVPMRLALVERYLAAADGEQDGAARAAQLQRAQVHAGEAAARATSAADHARALRYLGWTTAWLTDPSKGATLLEQSLAQQPGQPDTLWFLAVVRFDRLHDAAAAKPLLEQLLTVSTSDAQRTAVQTKLDKVSAALAGG